MSQKKIKKERRLKDMVIDKVVAKEVLGIREIFSKYWKYLVFLVLITLALYANSLGGDFVSDDYATISTNPEILNISKAFAGFSFVNISNYFLALIFGVSSPVPFHIYSLSWYLLSLVSVFVFVYLLWGERVAKYTSLFFAFMPIHVEAVSWISGKPYVMFAVFFLWTFNFFLQWRKSGENKYLWWFWVFFALTVKMDVVRSPGLVLALGVYMVIFDREILKRMKVGYVLGVLAGLGVSFALIWPTIKTRIMAINGGATGKELWSSPLEQYPTVIAKYLELTIFPKTLTLYHTMFVNPMWLNWVILLVFISLIIIYLKIDKRVAFSLLFIFLVSVGSMAPIKVGWWVAERYLFLGSLGVAMFVGLLMDKIALGWKYLPVVVLLPLLSWYGYLVLVRNHDWSTNHNLWVQTVKASPNSHNAWNNIGDDYDKLGEYEKAIESFTKSTEMKEDYADAYHNRANIYYKIGDYENAARSYSLAIEKNPLLKQSYMSLIQTYLTDNKTLEAVKTAEALLNVDPADPMSWYAGAVTLVNAGDAQGALAALDNCLKLAPNMAQAVELKKTIMSNPLYIDKVSRNSGVESEVLEVESEVVGEER